MNLSSIVIRRPVLTVVLMSALVIFGGFAFWKLPINELPNVDFPTVTVTISLPGAGPETMASAVATPLERAFSAIAGLDSMASTSATGTARIVIQFKLERDIDAAVQDVQAAISQATKQLPPNGGPAAMPRSWRPSPTPLIPAMPTRCNGLLQGSLPRKSIRASWNARSMRSLENGGRARSTIDLRESDLSGPGGAAYAFIAVKFAGTEPSDDPRIVMSTFLRYPSTIIGKW